jgi:signal transduction histidine kinase
MRLTVRWRLTLWFAGSAVVLLLLLGAAVWILEQAILERQAQASLHTDLQVVAAELARDPDDLDEPERAGLAEAYAVWRDGRPAHFSTAWRHFGLGDEPPADGRRVLHERTIRLAAGEVGTSAPGLRVAVAHDETLTVKATEMLALLFAGAVPIAALGAVATGWTVAGRALEPTRILRRDLERIEAERLHERVSVGRAGDEFGRLSSVINAMLERIERSMEARRRFAADASHQMRTPLASLRAVGESALRRHPDDAEALRDVVGSMLEECQRLSRLTTGLLELTRGEHLAVQRSDVRLVPVLEQLAEHLGPLTEASEQRLCVHVDAADADATAHTAVEPIRRALIGLVENAIVHCPPGTRIDLGLISAGSTPDAGGAPDPGRVRTGTSDAGATADPVAGPPRAGGPIIVVRDDGPGIPPAERDRIFEPLVRGAEASDRPGCGLGLALARTAVEVAGGRLELDPDHGDGGGTCFRIHLPPSRQQP